jgi:hypothetical protein
MRRLEHTYAKPGPLKAMPKAMIAPVNSSRYHLDISSFAARGLP